MNLGLMSGSLSGFFSVHRDVFPNEPMGGWLIHHPVSRSRISASQVGLHFLSDLLLALNVAMNNRRPEVSPAAPKPGRSVQSFGRSGGAGLPLD